jgi:hypothetical protein
MRTWNTHAWYVTGILLTLLVGTLSVKLNPGDNLGAIVSFALGLSSLILAIVAIVQSLVGGSEVSKSLGEVRAASEGIKAAADDLKSLASQVSGVGSKMVETQGELAGILKNQSQLNIPSGTGTHEGLPTKPTGKINLIELPMGGAEAMYAAAWSMETQKPFLMGLFAEDDNFVPMAFDDGYLSALIRAGLITAEKDGSLVTIKDIGYPPKTARDLINQFQFGAEQQEIFKNRLARIDAFFASPATPK